MRLVLASASPRRVELLRAAGYDFETLPADVDESAVPGESAEAYVRRVASLKARAVAGQVPGCVVLAADTTVVVDGEMLGKPADGLDAARMLGRLSGRTHRVLTGVVAIAGGLEAAAVVSSAVRFTRLAPQDIAWYVGTGEPADKAGAYAVQGLGARFVESVDGSYTNVVGLPMEEAGQLLAEVGVPRMDGAGGGGAASAPRIDRA